MSQINKTLLQWAFVLIVVGVVINGLRQGELGWLVAIIIYFQLLWKLQAIDARQELTVSVLKDILVKLA